MSNLADPPLRTPLVEPPEFGKQSSFLITKVWNEWFRSVVLRVQTSAFSVPSARVSLSGQTAAIGLTSLVPVTSAGLYRVTWRFRVTQAATVSSSLQVVVTTTEAGIAVTQSGAIFTGNTVNTPLSGSFLVRCDAAVPLQYSTNFASVGATPMLYDLDLLVESF